MIYTLKRFSFYEEERITIHSNEYPALRTLENLGWPKDWCNFIKFVNPVIDDIHKSSYEIDQYVEPLFAWPRFQDNTDSPWTNPENFPYKSYFDNSQNYFLLFTNNRQDPEIGSSEWALYGDRNGYLYQKVGNFFPKYIFISSGIRDWYLNNFEDILGGQYSMEELMSSTKISNLYKAIEKL